MTENLRKLIPNMDEHALDLLKKLLDFNTQDRITAKDALDHVYFKTSSVEGHLHGSASCDGYLVGSDNRANEQENDKPLLSLPDITNIFQPNILKRKRLKNQEGKRA